MRKKAINNINKTKILFLEKTNKSYKFASYSTKN